MGNNRSFSNWFIMAVMALFLAATSYQQAVAVVVDINVESEGEPVSDATISFETEEGEPIELEEFTEDVALLEPEDDGKPEEVAKPEVADDGTTGDEPKMPEVATTPRPVEQPKPKVVEATNNDEADEEDDDPATVFLLKSSGDGSKKVIVNDDRKGETVVVVVRDGDREIRERVLLDSDVVKINIDLPPVPKIAENGAPQRVETPVGSSDPALQRVAEPGPRLDDAPPPGAREILTFYALIGSKLGSYDAALSFGGNFVGDKSFSNPTLGFGFLYSPFQNLPLYFGFEGAAFLGSRGEIITVNLHPTVGDDTRVSAEPETALRFSVGTTIPFEGGCLTRFQCYSIDVEGGLTLEQIRYTFSTDESGGAGVNNSFSGSFSRLGLSVGAALNLPACQLIEMACNLVFAPYFRATFFNGDEESFQHTTATLNNVYSGEIKAERQVEAGLRVLFKF